MTKIFNFSMDKPELEVEDTKFSQESLSLLLNNGDTGVSVDNYIP